MAAQIPFGWSVRSRRPIDDRYIVADLTARDALDTFRRHEGLFCYVESNDKTYKLVGGITNTDWVEVLDNIGELGVGTPDTAADSVAYFDVTEGVHKKVLIQDLVSGSKWTDGVTPTRIYRDGNVVVGGSGAISDLDGLGVIARGTSFTSNAFVVRNSANTSTYFRINGQGALIADVGTIKMGAGLAGSAPTNTFRYVTTLGLGVNQTIFEIINGSSQVLLSINSNGRVRTNHLPTSDPLVSGMIWNDSGTLKISAG